MINFNELPNEIKEIIFQKNRPWTSRQIERNKDKFNLVLDELLGIADDTLHYFYNGEEEENIIDHEWGFSHAVLEFIREDQMENLFDDQMDEMIDNYYQLNE